jgi:hypothetical protein
VSYLWLEPQGGESRSWMCLREVNSISFSLLNSPQNNPAPYNKSRGQSVSFELKFCIVYFDVFVMRGLV